MDSRFLDIEDKMNQISQHLKSFNESQNRMEEKMTLLETNVQILEALAIDTAIQKRNQWFGCDTEEEEEEDLDSHEDYDHSHPHIHFDPSVIKRSKSFCDVQKKSSLASAARSQSMKNSTNKKRFSWSADFHRFGGSLLSLPTTPDIDPSPTVSPVVCGYLEVKKQTGFKGYKRYWCKLEGGSLYLYNVRDRKVPKQSIPLKGCAIRTSPERKNKFEIAVQPSDGSGSMISRQFLAPSSAEAREWVRSISISVDGDDDVFLWCGKKKIAQLTKFWVA